MSYTYGKVYARIYLGGFAGKELQPALVKEISRVLGDKFGLKFKVVCPKLVATNFTGGKLRKPLYALTLSARETEKFLALLGEFESWVPRCLLYKLGKDHKRIERGLKYYSERVGRSKVRKHEWYDTIWQIKHLSPTGEVLWQESKHNDLVDEGERSIIMSYFRAEELPTAFYARLAYDSISLTDSLSDVQNEPSGNGYDPIVLERSSVGFPTIEQDAGDWRVVSKQITFTATVGNWGKVNVLFLATTSNNLGKLIACVPLTMTRVMNAGDSLVATIRIKLR
jgi:hypothetical protein